ncbi:MAG: relaxase/mobilization nuclease domain-containing protein [Nitrosospira sp.]|nr:relaxase/mobilization nuclease domain-containing protein [Nitrosospira sp.]
MIAKHIPMKSMRRSSFSELVAYITHAKDKAVRIGAVRVTNCHQDNALDAVHEILATQLQNRRACSDKTYHLLISFDAGDRPSADTLQSIEDEVCASLGFNDHQRISAVHTDTDNLHMHVAINKIHPHKRTIHNPYCDYKALGALCQRLEVAHGLIHTNHETIARGARSRALDMEHAAGVESLLGWIRRECLSELRQASSWAALHQALNQNGLALREQGNGLIVSDQEGRMVKASSIARELSKAQLEKRLGPFVPFLPDNDRQVQAVRSYQVRPVARNSRTDELYRRYQAEQAQRCQARTRIRRQLHLQNQNLLNDARGLARMKRGLIKQLDCDRLIRRVLYHQASAGLGARLQTIQEEHQVRRAESLAPVKAVSWFDWLGQRAVLNDKEALAALRQRKSRAARRANSLMGVRQGRAEQGGAHDRDGLSGGLRIDGVTRQGTIIHADGKSAIRDSGHCLEVSDGIRQDGLEIALHLAVRRFGPRITLTGDADFRERVLRTSEALNLSITFTSEAQQQIHRPVPDELQRIKPQRVMLPDAISPDEEAARRYIAEREMKRQQIAGIPRHVLGDVERQGQLRYAGWRRVDGQLLLLAKTRADEIAVMPADAAMIARISRVKLGETIRLEERGGDQLREVKLGVKL